MRPEENFLVERLQLLTVPEAAAYLRIPWRSLYRHVENGEIPHLRVGLRRIRFRRHDLDEWMRIQAERALSGEFS